MKKTTARGEWTVVMILQSVRRTRSRRRDFCVQMGFGVCTNKHPLAKWDSQRNCLPVLSEISDNRYYPELDESATQEFNVTD